MFFLKYWHKRKYLNLDISFSAEADSDITTHLHVKEVTWQSDQGLFLQHDVRVYQHGDLAE